MRDRGFGNVSEPRRMQAVWRGCRHCVPIKAPAGLLLARHSVAYLGRLGHATVAGRPPASQVSVMEDDDGRMHIRNLTAHRTANEEEALNLVRHQTCHLGWTRV